MGREKQDVEPEMPVPWRHRAHGSKSRGKASAWEPQQNKPSQAKGDLRTTLLLQHLPPSCTSAFLTIVLEQQGLRGSFTFVYVPASFQDWSAIGYGLVDM